MIAAKVTGALFFSVSFIKLKFPIMSYRPCVGRVSAGELNVI